MNHSAAVDDLIEAIKYAIEYALDEGRPKIAGLLLDILKEIEWRATPPTQ